MNRQQYRNDNLPPEDPEMLKIGGQVVLEPMVEGQFYGEMQLGDAANIVKSKLIIRLGAENYKLLLLGVQGLLGLCALYILYRIAMLFFSRTDDPIARRLREIEQKEKEREIAAKNRKENNTINNNSSSSDNTNKNKKNQQEEEQHQNTSTKQQQKESTNAAAVFSFPMCRRTREPTLSKPSSSRKGFDLVSVCKGSPDANIVVVAERAHRTVSVFAQHKSFVPSFKTTLNIATPFTDVDSSAKPLITSLSFSPDSRYMCLYDVAIQSISVLRNDTSAESNHTEFAKSATVTPTYTIKLNDMKGLLPAPKGVNWGNQFAAYFPLPAPDRLCFYHNDGCLMLFDGRSGEKVSSHKKSLGNTVAWGISAENIVALAGSTMHETHLYHVGASNSSHHHASSNVTLERFGPALSPSNKKISNIVLSPDAKVLMVLPEDSSTFTVSFLYDVNLQNGDSPSIAIELTDEDFLDPALRSKLQVEMTHFAPNPTNPDKHATFVTLRIGGDFVVYRIDSFEANPQVMSRKPTQPHLHRVLEVHGAHGNDSALIGTAIVGRGRGIMTATESDTKKSLSCWELNNHA